MMSLLGLVLAFALVEVLVPAFDNFLQRPIRLLLYRLAAVAVLWSGLAVAAGLISGSYPALVLSRFRPAATLRTNSAGQSGSGAASAILLVVLQFAVSIGLGIAALVVFSQINFARNIDRSLPRDNILVMNSGRMTPEQRETFCPYLAHQSGCRGCRHVQLWCHSILADPGAVPANLASPVA